jgi:hypothetical protein
VPVAELENLSYDPGDIAALHLRSAVKLRRITRKEFLSRLQLTRELEPIVTRAWKEVEQKRAEGENEGHGEHWHTSFHGSQFPGDRARACPREAMYRMMDFAREPFSRKGRTVMDIGKAMEVTLVEIFHEAGMLLSAPPDAEVQTRYEDPEHWMTATTDAIILPPRWNQPLPIEVKSKDLETIQKMLVGAVGPDDAHVRQCKVEIAITRIMQRELWPGLDLADHGVIYYMSRGDKKGDPKIYTAEFRVDYDETFWLEGLKRLKEWREMFLKGELPQTNENVEKRYAHPFGWKWGEQPCVWCDFGKECRIDTKALTTDLLQSAGIERTKKVRPDYDPQVVIQRVKDRWQAE